VKKKKRPKRVVVEDDDNKETRRRWGDGSGEGRDLLKFPGYMDDPSIITGNSGSF